MNSRIPTPDDLANYNAYGEPDEPTTNGDDTQRKSQASLLVELATERCELWHDRDGDCYVSIEVDSHVEHHKLGSRHFKRWLARLAYERLGKAPSANALNEASAVLEGVATFEGERHQTHVRVAPGEGTWNAIELDVANEHWQAVEITANGWRLVDKPTARFRRARAMQPLPVPQTGGGVDMLREFVNVTDDEWCLLVAWLVGALRNSGPYPVLALHGEQGSAKTTTARVLRSLLDANTAPVRAAPKDVRDLAIAANNGWIVALDNLSGVPGWLSDALCRLATGGGFATRMLYENDAESIFESQRPAILTGIEDLASRGDLLDRSILLTLPTIPEYRRRLERDFWREFDEAAPFILGGLLDAVSQALRDEHSVQLPRLPRLADFAAWVCAAAPALEFDAGEFLDAYADNRTCANAAALESSPITQHVVELANDGILATATELLAELESRAGLSDNSRKPKGWPASGRTLSGQLRRLAPNLRHVGVEVDFHRHGKQRTRLIEIRKTPSAPSASSADSTTAEKQTACGDNEADARRTQQGVADAADDTPF